MLTQNFPPPNYIPIESTIDGIEIFKPAPQQQAHQEIVQFNCPQCGATTAYSVADGGLTCTHCGYHEAPQYETVGRAAERFEFRVETMERAAHGWGEARKELQCQTCAAYTSLAVDSLTHTCPFCASNKVIQGAAPQDVLRPRFLIPFRVEANACHDITRQWLGATWLTPRPLRNLARIAKFNGIYLPFWTFEALTRADWKAEVGHKKTETYYANGERRTRTKIVWKWESGRASLNLNDLLIDGTTKVSPLLLKKIRDFGLDKLAPYEPKYLAGFQAQAYDIPLEAAWEIARHDMREQARSACRNQASTNRIRNFQMTLDFDEEGWRYILLPVWLAVYHYEDKTYQVMINGQTGTIAGQRPVDWAKVWLAIAALLGPGITLGLIGLVMMFFDLPGFLVSALGFVLLLVGLVISIVIFSKASGLDDA